MNVGVYGKENSGLILCECVLGVCVFLSVRRTVEGTDSVLFGPGREVGV